MQHVKTCMLRILLIPFAYIFIHNLAVPLKIMKNVQVLIVSKKDDMFVFFSYICTRMSWKKKSDWGMIWLDKKPAFSSCCRPNPRFIIVLLLAYVNYCIVIHWRPFIHYHFAKFHNWKCRSLILWNLSA